MLHVNENYQKIQASYLFTEIAHRVAAHQEAHPDAKIIRLGIGDVTEPLCDAVVKAMHAAVDDEATRANFHGYGPEQGYAFLREAAAKVDFQDRGIDIAADEIFISDGAKCDCGNIQELFGPDVKIAVGDPVYPVYVDTNVMAGRTGTNAGGRYAGLTYLTCDASNGFVPGPDAAKGCDIVYLCYPNNPTGAIATKAQLQQWVDWANANKALILFDAAYEAFIRTPGIPHSIYECTGARTCAVEFRSFSKTAGFTGIRCGYTVVPKGLMAYAADGTPVELRPMWTRRQTTKFNGASYITQRGAAAIYTPEGQAQTKATIDFYLENGMLMKKALQDLGYTVTGGGDSPYLWVNVKGESWAFFDKLLKEANVVTTPGAGFGQAGEGYIRISSFNSRANVLEAIERLKKVALTEKRRKPHSGECMNLVCRPISGRGFTKRGPLPPRMRFYGAILAILGALSAFGANSAVDTISDVRVGPLLATHWNQMYAVAGGIYFGNPCYNYYTPNNCYCGCVATAFAQVMKYHEWPKTSVTPSTYECTYNGASTNLTMKGGVYDWANMPADTDNSTSELRREAIGRLCYDFGVTMGAIYNTSGTAANAASAIHSLTNDFGYASSQAISFKLSTNMKEYTLANFQKMIVPSLDAGCPCVITIDGGYTHTVALDGYGYNADGDFMVHIQAGYSGTFDGWYKPPYFDISNVAYTNITIVNFNISPTRSGSIGSGRVLAADQTPIANARVVVTKNGITNTVTVSNEKGIYYFWGEPGTYTVKASRDGQANVATVTLGANQSIYADRGPTVYLDYYAPVAVGNSAWNDIVLGAANQVATPTGPASPVTFTGSTTVTLACATAGATIYYTTDGSAPSTGCTAYTGPVTLTESATVKAIAVKSGMSTSDVATFTFIEPTLGNAIECPTLPWRTGGDLGAWTVVTDNTNDGVDALRTGQPTVYKNQGAASWLKTELKGPATLSYKYAIFGYYYSPFTVTLDDATELQREAPSWGQTSVWYDNEVTIPAGEHSVTFAFTVSQYGFPAGYSNGVWLDQVTYTYTGSGESGDAEGGTIAADPNPEDDPQADTNANDRTAGQSSGGDDAGDDEGGGETGDDDAGDAATTNHIPIAVSLAFSMTDDNTMMVSYEVSSNGVTTTWDDDAAFTFTETGTGRNLWRGDGNKNIGSALVKDFGVASSWDGFPVPNTNLEQPNGTATGKYWEIDVPFDLKGGYPVTNFLPKAFITTSNGTDSDSGQPVANNKQLGVKLFVLTADKITTQMVASVTSGVLGATRVNDVAGSFTGTLSNGVMRIRVEHAAGACSGAFGGIEGIDFTGSLTEITGGGSAPEDPSSETDPADEEENTNGILPAGAAIKVGPLTKTLWNQGRHYNRMCPVTDNDKSPDGRMYAGCVATAVATILGYYQWPAQGRGSTYYEVNEASWPYNSLFMRARFDQPYDWEAMRNTYGSIVSRRASLAIATLLSDVGAILGMEYGASGSSTDSGKVPALLKAHFLFDDNLHDYAYPYSAAQEAEIQAQLAAGHPILCSSAAENSSGHSYVCDGWAQNVAGGVTNNYYHFNFGWGGSYNGWYTLGKVTIKSTAGGTATTWKVGRMFLNVLPQKAPQILPRPGVTGPSGEIEWRIANCWTNNLTSITVERQEKQTVAATKTFTSADWGLETAAYGWALEGNEISATMGSSWGSVYWPGWGSLKIWTNEGLNLTADTSIELKYSARQFPSGVTLKLMQCVYDSGIGAYHNYQGMDECVILKKLPGGTSTSAMTEQTVTISGSDIVAAFGGAVDDVHLCFIFEDMSGGTTYAEGTEVFHLTSFKLTGMTEEWVTVDGGTTTYPATQRTHAYSGLAEKNHRFKVTANYADGTSAAGTAEQLVSNTAKVPAIAVSGTRKKTVSFTISDADSFSYGFEKQINDLAGSAAKNGNVVTYTFASNDVATVGTHWLTLYVTNTATLVANKYVYITNPPADAPLGASDVEDFAAAAARARAEGKMLLLIGTGEADNVKYRNLAGMLSSNEVVTAAQDKYIITEALFNETNAEALLSRYWKPQVAGGTIKQTEGYLIVIDPRTDAATNQLTITSFAYPPTTTTTIATFLSKDYGVVIPEGDWIVDGDNLVSKDLKVVKVVVGGVTNDISAAFSAVTTNVAGEVSYTLDAAGAVTVGGETITVVPVLGVITGDEKLAAEPFVLTDSGVAMGIKSIPGLTYVLLRGGSPETITETLATDGASAKASGNRVRLEDANRPAGKAFYRVRVDKQ